MWGARFFALPEAEREAISFLRPRSASGFILAEREAANFPALNAVGSFILASKPFVSCVQGRNRFLLPRHPI